MVALVGMTGLINDIPSVTEGVDIGPEPTPFQQAQLLAAEAWGARRSWFLINGASQGNHATSWRSATWASGSSCSGTSTPR